MYDYSNLIMIDPDGNVSRTPVLPLAYGFSPEDLANLAQFGETYELWQYKWYPGVRISQDLPRGMKFGKELYQVDEENKQIFYSYEILPFSEEDIQNMRNDQLYVLNDQFTKAMQRLQTGWPIYEVMTWDKQSREANAWLAAPADDKPDTPFLSSLVAKCNALGADDTLEDLVARVHANDVKYTEAVTAIMAVRHVAEDKINAADVPYEIEWKFPS